MAGKHDYSDFLNYLKKHKEKLNSDIITKPNVQNIDSAVSKTDDNIDIDYSGYGNGSYTNTVSDSLISMSKNNINIIFENWLTDLFISSHTYSQPNLTSDDITFCVKKTYLLRHANITKSDITHNYLIHEYLSTVVKNSVINLFNFQDKFKVITLPSHNIKDTIDAVYNDKLIIVNCSISDSIYNSHLRYYVDKAILISHILNVEYNHKIKYLDLLTFNLLNKSTQSRTVELDFSKVGGILNLVNNIEQHIKQNIVPNVVGTKLCNICCFQIYCLKNNSNFN